MLQRKSDESEVNNDENDRPMRKIYESYKTQVEEAVRVVSKLQPWTAEKPGAGF